MQDDHKTIINSVLDAGVRVVLDGVDRLVGGLKVELLLPPTIN
ncbi:MAG: hypothetical protein ACL7BU_15405 [Candidatus Phlomobacter fragariae]